jgi:thiol-disulfide isomerase/thioredoxin
MTRFLFITCILAGLASCSEPSGNAGSADLQGLARDSLKKMEIFLQPKAFPDLMVSVGVDETPVALADVGDGARLINLWATWCAPCVKELPALDRLAAEKNSDAFEVVAISVDRGKSQKLLDFLKKTKVSNLPLVRDPEAAFPQAMGLGVLPVTFVVSKDGEIIGQLLGEADWDSKEAKAFVDALAAGES